MRVGPVKFSVLVAAGVLSLGGVATASSKGPNPSGPAQYGLCKAYANIKGKGAPHKRDAAAFAPLRTAAGAANQSVADFCKGAKSGNTTDSSNPGQGATISSLAKTTDATGVDKGAAVSGAASGSKSQAGQHGKP